MAIGPDRYSAHCTVEYTVIVGSAFSCRRGRGALGKIQHRVVTCNVHVWSIQLSDSKAATSSKSAMEQLLLIAGFVI